MRTFRRLTLRGWQAAAAGRLPHLPQPAQRLDDRRVSPEENSGVVGFERLEAPIGGPVRIVCGRPFEIAGVDSEALDPDLEVSQALLGKCDPGGPVARRQRDVEDDGTFSCGQIDLLVLGRHFASAEPRWVSARRSAGRMAFGLLPCFVSKNSVLHQLGRGPFRRNKDDDHFAAIDGRLQRSSANDPPSQAALAGRDQEKRRSSPASSSSPGSRWPRHC